MTLIGKGSLNGIGGMMMKRLISMLLALMLLMLGMAMAEDAADDA